ncbi:MAG: acetylxylan esterase [Phycisphaerae bacterium]|nr:acetylxylan esterase [Phycisphaerae bacterium]
MNLRIFGRIERDGYTVEKVYLESTPGFFVTGNLYRPRAAAGKHPGVACPHGHWQNGRLHDDERGSVPARCITLARMGCVVFSYDMIGYNDSAHQIIHRFEGQRETLWNIHPLGVQLWNSLRVVDFLESLPDVDPERIGCTGASGGGTQTFLLSAVDDRIRVAAPVNMISCHMQGGCVCENAPGLRFETNNIEIGTMMAPRPLFLVSATGDWTDRTPSVEFPAIQAVYRLYGAEDSVGMVQIDADHNYNRASREAVYGWFAKWLLGRASSEPIPEPAYQKEDDKDLLVFVDGKLPENARDQAGFIADRIEAARLQADALRPVDAERLKTFRAVAGEGLRFALGLRPAKPGEVTFEVDRAWTHENVRMDAGVLVERVRGTRVPAVVFLPKAAKPDTAWAVLVDGAGKEAWLKSDGVTPGAFVRGLVAVGHRVVAIDAFGIGEAVGEQDPAQPRGSTKHFMTFNRTDTAERACDVATAIGWCRRGERSAGGGPVHVVGAGQGGIWCLLACAALGSDPVAKGWLGRLVIDVDEFDTTDEHAYLTRCLVPGLPRVGGLPAAAALISPYALLLHDTGSRFDTAWANGAYAGAWGSALVIRPEPQDVSAMLAWLTASE